MFGFFGCMLGSDGLQFKPFIAFCVSNQVDNDTQRHTTTKTAAQTREMWEQGEWHLQLSSGSVWICSGRHGPKIPNMRWAPKCLKYW